MRRGNWNKMTVLDSLSQPGVVNNTDFHVSSLAAICHNLTDWKLASVILLIQLGHSDLPPTVSLWLDTLFSGVKHDTEPLSLCRRFYLRAGCQKWSDSSSHELLLPPLWVWDGWLAHGDWRLEIWTADSVTEQSRGFTGTAATHPSVSPGLPQLSE